MKKLIGALMLMLSLSANAETKMILHQKSGGDVEVMLKDKPVATYEDNDLVIKTTATTLRFSLSSLEKITYEDLTTPVESVTILSQDAGSSHIYDLNGTLIKTVPAGQPVETSTLPQGIYIIKNNNHTYKIQKK